jgi:hypothetical protein
MENKSEVEILTEEVFEVRCNGVGHPSPLHLDIGFCSHGVYQLNGRTLANGSTDIDLTCGK